MNTLTLKTNILQEKTVEIPIPFFAKNYDGSDYIALLDEKTVVNIYQSTKYTLIKNTIPSFGESLLMEAFEKWHPCTETEFLEKYDAVIESISLTPKLVV